MKNAIWRRARFGLLVLALAPGCGGKDPMEDVKPDPALANKPFPEVGTTVDESTQKKTAGFPAANSAGSRKRP